MRGRICHYTLCLAVLATGCQSLKQMTASKSKTDVKVQNTQASNSSLGSPDFSASQKKVDETKLHLTYAAWHEQSGNYKEARESYQKVLDKNRKNTDALLGLARIDRVYGREAQADELLKKAQKYHPKDPKILVAIGQVHASKREWAQALEMMQEAHNLEPYETIYEYHLGVVEARSGDVPKALEHFTRSIGQAEAHFNVGLILKEQGDQTEAENHLMKALKLKPELKQAEALLASIRTGESDIQPASFNKNDRRPQ